MAKDWKETLGEYIREGEPNRVEKAKAWKAAIGLQDVDGLKTSEYLLAVAQRSIEGSITFDQAKNEVEGYYEVRADRNAIEAETAEADIVSARIAALLAQRSFHFSPTCLLAIHADLFAGVIKHAGEYRTYDITKREWVLNGDTVLYSSFGTIRETLEYDFAQERAFSYASMTIDQSIAHLAAFAAGIWQIHPFCEGNTRTTAVFLLKYLNVLGFKADNTLFEENSWYFRNALVRANYTNLQRGIHEQTVFLERFLANLLTGASYELKNRYCHIDWKGEEAQSITSSAPKSQIDTLECTLEEMTLLKYLEQFPHATQKDMASHIRKSQATIKRLTVAMQEKGLIERVNGKRHGYWRVLAENLEGDGE